MQVFGWVLAALAGWTAIGIAGTVLAWATGDRRRAWRGLAWLGGVWVVYVAVLLGVSERQRQKTIPRGQEECFDGMCFSVVEVEEVGGGGGDGGSVAGQTRIPFGNDSQTSEGEKQVPVGNDSQKGRGEKQVPFGNDNKKGKGEKQVPFGNDSQKGKDERQVPFGNDSKKGKGETQIPFGNDSQEGKGVGGEGTGRLLRVGVRVRNAAGELHGVEGLRGYLVDAAGGKWEETRGVGGVLLTARLPGGGVTTSEPMFRVADGAKVLGLVLTREHTDWRWLVIGDTDAIGHRDRRTMLLLE